MPFIVTGVITLACSKTIALDAYYLHITVATPIFLSQTAFSYRFHIVFESYRFMPFQKPFEGKNGV